VCLFICTYVCMYVYLGTYLLPMEELSIQIISIVRVLIDVCTSIRFVRLICTIYNGGTVNSKRNEPRSPPPVSLTCLCQRKETCQTSERNDPHERFLLRKSDTNTCRSSVVERSFLVDRVLLIVSCRLYKRPSTKVTSTRDHGLVVSTKDHVNSRDHQPNGLYKRPLSVEEIVSCSCLLS